MSSGGLSGSDSQDFLWQSDLDEGDYLFATFTFESHFEPDLVACSMAKEQSTLLGARQSTHGGGPSRLSARVRKVVALGETTQELLPGYHLDTHAYPKSGADDPDRTFVRAQTCIGYPVALLKGGMTGFWSIVIGELPRLGYLNAVRLVDVRFPPSYLARFKGPRYGVSGLREMSGVFDRPLFCRAARPPVGPVDKMVETGRQVLRGGFDALKDDENTLSTDLEEFESRVRTMATMVRETADETREGKLYFANLVDCTGEWTEALALAHACGVHGILVAPGIQGHAVIEQARATSDLAILAHNNGLDIWTRHPRIGVAPSILILLQRIAGADLVFLPGEFATESANGDEMVRCIAACQAPIGDLRPCLPVMAGGKQPEELASYLEAVGGTDFMLIAASSVDAHPQGPRAGALAFRTAWSELKTTGHASD